METAVTFPRSFITRYITTQNVRTVMISKLPQHYLFIYLFIYLKIRTMYRGENNRTRSPLLGSPSYSDPIKCRKTNPLPQKTRIKY